MTANGEADTRRRFRITAFRLGVAAGLVLPILLIWGVMGLVDDVLGLEKPEYNIEVVSRGADLSRHGAARLVVESEDGAVAQVCRDGCDDIELRESSGDNSYDLKVLDASGACIACDAGGYVTGGYGGWVDRWTVAGASKLTIRQETFNLRADGSVEPIPDEPTPSN